MSEEEVRRLIRDTLVEPAGSIDKDLVLACKGFFSIDDQSKKVTLENLPRISDRVRIVLYCLGRRLLASYVGDPSLAEVKPADLLGVCMADTTNKINVYFSRLMKESPKPLRRGRRGSYEVNLPVMKSYMAGLQQYLNETGN